MCWWRTGVGQNKWIGETLVHHLIVPSLLFKSYTFCQKQIAPFCLQAFKTNLSHERKKQLLWISFTKKKLWSCVALIPVKQKALFLLPVYAWPLYRHQGSCGSEGWDGNRCNSVLGSCSVAAQQKKQKGRNWNCIKLILLGNVCWPWWPSQPMPALELRSQQQVPVKDFLEKRSCSSLLSCLPDVLAWTVGPTLCGDTECGGDVLWQCIWTTQLKPL